MRVTDMHNMTYGELIEHAARLHVLASSRNGTRTDLVQLRDLVPRLIEAIRDLSHDKNSDETVVAFPKAK